MRTYTATGRPVDPDSPLYERRTEAVRAVLPGLRQAATQPTPVRSIRLHPGRGRANAGGERLADSGMQANALHYGASPDPRHSVSASCDIPAASGQAVDGYRI